MRTLDIAVARGLKVCRVASKTDLLAWFDGKDDAAVSAFHLRQTGLLRQ